MLAGAALFLCNCAGPYYDDGGASGAYAGYLDTARPYTDAVAVYTDLVRYRELFANLFRRDFHAKY